SHMIRSPSLTVGTSPFGFSFKYSGSLLPPNGPPISTRSNGRSSSAQHHSTFCTFEDVDRPQIFSMETSRLAALFMEPEFSGERNRAQVLHDPHHAPCPCHRLRHRRDRAGKPAGHRDIAEMEGRGYLRQEGAA